MDLHLKLLLCVLLLSSTLSRSIYDNSASQSPSYDHLSFTRQCDNGRCTLQQHLQRNSTAKDTDQPVLLQIQDKYVVINNGKVEVTLLKPEGIVSGIRYNGIDNVLEDLNHETDRGYWDMVWSDDKTTRKKGNFDRLLGTSFTVIAESEEQVELSFLKGFDPAAKQREAPLQIDKRFVFLRGCSGFYTYAIYERQSGWPAFELANTRIAFKLRKDKFHYMAITDKRQRFMPLPDDRLPDRGRALAYPEAVLLVNPIEEEFKGEVDDKYQYACEHHEILVHGWISTGSPPVGFWQITPSNEFRSGGPLKQSLTSHVGPTSLSVFHSTHYAGLDITMKFGPNEAWKKVFGPVFVYLNSIPGEGAFRLLWEDAKKQASQATDSWPYEFVASSDFPGREDRGTVFGKLLVNDSGETVSACGAYVVLANPGLAGSWQTESKGYQFWTRADEDGSFKIVNIRPGIYNLFASVPGFIGDYKYGILITITPGGDIELGDLLYEPTRSGPTLWEIGYPDRSAAEFFIPDANSTYLNKLYLNQDKFRQYGLWERYADLYPVNDLVFNAGSSNFSKDWFFAHVTRKTGNMTYEGSTWQIKFNLDNVCKNGTYVLRLVLATANVAELQVRVNDPGAQFPLFTTGIIGRDNTIARHGIHGLYRLFSVSFPGTRLQEGNNTLYLSQTRSTSPFQGIMYDYLRLEFQAS